MNVSSIDDRLLLIMIAQVNAEYERDEPARDLDARSTALNAEGANRWGDTVMDNLAEYVTRHRMTGDEFVAWAKRDGKGWLRRALS